MPNIPELGESINRLLEQIEQASEQKPLSEARRASWRYTWATTATVELVDPEGPSEPLYVTTKSISAHSLDFRSPRALERGCKVMITLDTDQAQLRIPATVMHSTGSVGMPIIGVEFDL